MIGFIFPVYYARLPLIVERFIKKIKFTNPQYIYGIITFGGIHGSVFSHLEKNILKSGGILNSKFKVRMPGNYINNYNAFPKTIQKILFHKQKYTTHLISTCIKNKELHSLSKTNLISFEPEKYIQKKFSTFSKLAKNYISTSKCISCGLCVKLCPVNNIYMKNDKPQWKDLCEQCVACIQWCPKNAIECGNKTLRRTRYTHPEIKVSDLLKDA